MSRILGLAMLDEVLDGKFILKKDTPVALMHHLQIGIDNTNPAANQVVLIHISDDGMRKEVMTALNKKCRFLTTNGDGIRSIEVPTYQVNNCVVITDRPDDIQAGLHCKVINTTENTLKIYTRAQRKPSDTVRLILNRAKYRMSIRVDSDPQGDDATAKHILRLRRTINLVDLWSQTRHDSHKSLTVHTDFRMPTATTKALQEEKKDDIEKYIKDCGDSMILALQREGCLSKMTESMVHTSTCGHFDLLSYDLYHVISALRGSSREVETSVDLGVLRNIKSITKRITDLPTIVEPDKVKEDGTLRAIQRISDNHHLSLQYHQIYAAYNMVKTKLLILHAEVGLGKTRTALATVLTVNPKRVIYLTEPGIVPEVVREFESLGYKDWKLLKKPGDTLAQINIMGYSQFRSPEMTKYLRRFKFGMIIGDECQNLRNLSSTQCTNISKIRTKRWYFMSGTTLPHDPSDMLSYLTLARELFNSNHNLTGRMPYSLKIDTVNKTTLHSSCIPGEMNNIHTTGSYENARSDLKYSMTEPTARFKSLYFLPILKSNKKLVKNANFRVKAKEQKMRCSPDKYHMDLYLERLTRTNEEFDNSQKQQTSLTMIQELIKISEVPHIFEQSLSFTEKQKKIVTAVEEKTKLKNSVIVFTGFTESAKHLYDIVSGETSVPTYLLTSDRSKNTRFNIIEQYRHDEHAVIIGNIGILGKGFNLEVADTVIMSDIPWSPFQYDQSIGRILRPDQKGSPEVINAINRLMIDEYKFEVLLTKKARIDRMVNEDSKVSEEYTKHINFTDFLESVIVQSKKEGLL